jgi:hypothetical protein
MITTETDLTRISIMTERNTTKDIELETKNNRITITKYSNKRNVVNRRYDDNRRYASNRQSSNNHSKYDRKEGMKETTPKENRGNGKH